MKNDRDAFIEKYLELVEHTVRGYLLNYVKSRRGDYGWFTRRAVGFLFDEMFAEASLNLVSIADKFYSDDVGQKAYVENYIRRATITKCIDVLRDQYEQKDKISKILQKLPFPGGQLTVLEVEAGHSPPKTLADRIRQKDVIDWYELLPEADADLVVQFLATYETPYHKPTAEDKRTQNRLRPKVKAIVRRLLS